MNKKQFAQLMYALAGNFGATIEPITLDVWYELAQQDGLQYERLQEAAKKILRSKKDGYGRMPTYAEILEAARGPAPVLEDQALVEANKIIAHLHTSGASLPPEMPDPITNFLMSRVWPYTVWAAGVLEDDLKWWTKDFCAAYRATTKTHELHKQIPAAENKELEDLSKKIINLVPKVRLEELLL